MLATSLIASSAWKSQCLEGSLSPCIGLGVAGSGTGLGLSLSVKLIIQRFSTNREDDWGVWLMLQLLLQWCSASLSEQSSSGVTMTLIGSPQRHKYPCQPPAINRTHRDFPSQFPSRARPTRGGMKRGMEVGWSGNEVDADPQRTGRPPGNERPCRVGFMLDPTEQHNIYTCPCRSA